MYKELQTAEAANTRVRAVGSAEERKASRLRRFEVALRTPSLRS